ncbi:hypothetical protein [Aurantibacillus circumpalustris]|uniref:hypothetical protein n=1 Tax=Aurantibacillus circumpalustris TaxID=3036359 RepID=UPI00295A97B3|nr:hypothetical protein [Aurantibacillus circumpalustris]
MKLKTIFINIILVFILCCLSGCLKKGENDPSISLKTRTARLSRQWHLTTGTEEYTSTNTDSLGIHTSITTSIYTQKTFETVTDGGSYQNSHSGSFSYIMVFKNDGGFNSIKVNDNTSNTLEGT